MKKILITVLIIVCGSLGIVVLFNKKATEVEQMTDAGQETEFKIDNKKEKNDNKEMSYPVILDSQEAASLTVVVNKKHRLREDYVPDNLINVPNGQLRLEAAEALEDLLNNQQVKLKAISAYRSYDKQRQVYQEYVNKYGQAEADKFSARPGHSEHQTGLAVDVGSTNNVCDLNACFSETKEGRWLAENAQSYGFIIRYPKDSESITGYQFEPWHLRYVGVELAKLITDQGKTMDEYFNKPAGGY